MQTCDLCKEDMLKANIITFKTSNSSNKNIFLCDFCFAEINTYVSDLINPSPRGI